MGAVPWVAFIIPAWEVECQCPGGQSGPAPTPAVPGYVRVGSARSIPSWRPSAITSGTATRKQPSVITPSGEESVSGMFRPILCVRNVCGLGDTRPLRWSTIFYPYERAAQIRKVTSWLFATLVTEESTLREATAGTRADPRGSLNLYRI